MTQPLEPKRRTPRQARAKDTVEVILEAAARILQREGRAALTTNRMAEQGGISVGTLYQYFQNKEAVLLELARREIAWMAQTVAQAIAHRDTDSADDTIRRAIHALISESGKRRKVRQPAFQALVAEGFGHELERNLDHIAQAIGQLVPGGGKLPPVTGYILTRAVNGVLAAAAGEGSPHLGTQAFEDELVRLVRGFLSKPGTPNANP